MSLAKKAFKHFKKKDLIRWVWSTAINKLKLKSHVFRSFIYLLHNYTSLRCIKVSFKDIWLYSCYKNFEFKQPYIIQEDEKYYLIRVYNNEIYWPIKEDYKGLSWLYQELYIPFWRNPHSYFHHAFKIKKGMTIFDFGACEGFFSLYATKLEAYVYVVEPNPNLSSSLSKTLDHNKVHKSRYSIINKAFSNYNGIAHFNMHDEISIRKINDSTNGIQVDVVKLDTFVEENQINKIDILKLDVEGWEENILDGARNTLVQLKPKLAIAVYHFPEQAQKVLGLIKNINPQYRFELRGVTFYPVPPTARPMMLFAY